MWDGELARNRSDNDEAMLVDFRPRWRTPLGLLFLMGLGLLVLGFLGSVKSLAPGQRLDVNQAKQTKKKRKQTTKHQQRPRAQWWGWQRSLRLAMEPLPQPFEALKALHQVKKATAKGDWLSLFQESGQSLQRYRTEATVRPNHTWKYIYIQLLGPFTKEQRKVLRKTIQYMEAYFCLPVRVHKPLSLRLIPRHARRMNFGGLQLLTRYILWKVLKSRIPHDAVAYIAFTATDLWPGKGWNFVYGEAMLHERIGVWSVARFGTLGQTPANDRRFLRRTLKLATHETGHILSIEHCIAYECNMNGGNHMAEFDQSPLALGPVCLAKLIWNTRCNPAVRFQRLHQLTKRWGLQVEATFFKKSWQLVQRQMKGVP